MYAELSIAKNAAVEAGNLILGYYKADYDIKDNTWEGCDFTTCSVAINFGANTNLGTSGMLTGPINNTISHSTFDDISTNAINIAVGTDNYSIANKFYDCGNDMGSSATVAHPIIKFTAYKNSSENDWFKRTEELSFDPTYQVNIPYIPEIEGTAISEIGTKLQSNYKD